ncbi:MAG TPA: AMP-binding protein [Chloroflexota bacterium]
MDILTGLRRAAQCFGDCPAVIDGPVRYTWRQFDARTRLVAAGLRGIGVQPGDRVAVLMLNNYRYLELYHALPRMGGVIVPINTRLTAAEIADTLMDSGATVLVVDKTLAPLAAAVGGSRRVVYAADGASPAGMLPYEQLPVIGAQQPALPEQVPDPDDVVGLFYTGGTTASAKGVMLTHKNMVTNSLHAIPHVEARQSDNYLYTAPLFHVAAAGCFPIFTLVGGCHTVLRRFDPSVMLETIQRERVTVTMLVPTMINALLQTPTIGDYDLSSWRLLVYAASAIAPALLRRTMAALPCGLAQAFGLTEAAPCVTWLSVSDHRAIRDAAPGSCWERRAASCGQPMIGVEVRVVNEQEGDVGPGEVGEIIVRGDNVTSGYWNKPSETAEALRDGWLRTGDLASADEDFYLTIVDRKKDMIISGGENIYSIEVEAALYAHPAVLEAAVIAVPDTKWGDRVHAVVALRPGQSATPEDLEPILKPGIVDASYLV